MDEIDRMNTPIEENYYPIHEACKTNNIVAVKHLLPHVNINICSPIGTPLMIACKYNYSELIDLLIGIVNLDVKDKKGNTFLHYLVQHPDTENRLPLFGDFLTLKNKNGNSPLDYLKFKKCITIDIIESLPHVYFFDGHSCDMGIEKIVPEDCLYITLTLCGNTVSNEKLKHFYSIDPDLLLDPIKNKRSIERRLGIPIQINKPGDTYSDILYSTPLFFKVPLSNGKLKTLVCPSGLQNVYLKEELYVDTSDSELKKKVFQYSILPQIEDIPDTDDIEKTWEVTILQSRLFEYKGIFYNVSCRGACNEESKSRISLRRQKSITRRIAEGNVKTLEQLREADTPTLNEWIEDPGILFHAPREGVLELVPKEKHDLLALTKFLGGKRKSRKRRIK